MTVIIIGQVLICPEAGGKSCYNEEHVLTSKSSLNRGHVIRDNITGAGVK